jgi:polar amino acid transport system substrate-binding protein
MKRLIVLSVLLLLVILYPVQAEEPVTIVEFIHPPFVYKDTQSNEVKGAEITYLKDILKDLGYKPTVTIVPFPRMLIMLETGDADIGPFLTKTAQREVFAYYSSKPVLTMSPILVVLKDSPLKKLKKPSDLKDLKIGFAQKQTVPAFFKNSGLPPFDLASGDNLTEQNLKKLINKRFDTCIELNPFNTKLVAKTMGITNSIRLIDIPDSETNFYIIISKKSKIGSDILKGINARMKLSKYNFEKYLQKELK